MKYVMNWEQIISREPGLKQQESGPETNYNISVMGLSRRKAMYSTGARFIHETRPETGIPTTWLRPCLPQWSFWGSGQRVPTGMKVPQEGGQCK